LASRFRRAARWRWSSGIKDAAALSAIDAEDLAIAGRGFDAKRAAAT
jgi:hypothetical protein